MEHSKNFILKEIKMLVPPDEYNYSNFSIKPNEYMLCRMLLCTMYRVIMYYVSCILYTVFISTSNAQPNHRTTKTMQQRKQNELWGIILHTNFPKTKHTNR